MTPTLRTENKENTEVLEYHVNDYYSILMIPKRRRRFLAFFLIFLIWKFLTSSSSFGCWGEIPILTVLWSMFCHSAIPNWNLLTWHWIFNRVIWIAEGCEKIHFSTAQLFKDFFDHCQATQQCSQLRSTKETDYWHIKSDIYDFLIQIYAKQTQNFHAFSSF